MKKIVTKWEKKIFFYLSKVGTVEVVKTPTHEDLKDFPWFIVRLNGSEQNIFYDGKFYIEMVNNEEQLKELEAHSEELKKLKEEWKTEEEINEYIKWKGTQYIDLVEFIIDNEEVINSVKKGVELL